MTELEEQIAELEKKASEVKEDFIKDTPTFFRRAWNRIKKIGAGVRAWFDRPIKIADVVVFIAICSVVLGVFFGNKEGYKAVTEQAQAIIKSTPIIKLEKDIEKEDKVEDKKVRYAALNIDGKIISIDLSKLKVTKTVATTNLKNKKKMIGVSYALEMGMKDRKGSSIYLTIYEDEDSLDVTKEYKDLLVEKKES